METPAAAAVVTGVALILAWVRSTSRHVDRRAARSADWKGAGDKPELWASSARCPHCGVPGGLLQLRGEQLELVCLSCQRTSPRETRA